MNSRILIFSFFGYLSGSVMYAYLLPKLLYKKDITEISRDKNPGVANVFMNVGMGCGILVLCLELLKAFIPVFLSLRYGKITGKGIFLVLISPVLGHGFSIFFHGNGGKAIAASFGSLLGLFPNLMPALALAVLYITFSLIIVISPHLHRSIVTFACFSFLSFAMDFPKEIAAGCCCISMIVVTKHLQKYCGEKLKITVLRHNRE